MWQHFYGKHTVLQSLFFPLLFLKSIRNWPLCPEHLARSFNLEAHWVSLKSTQLGDFGTRMKGQRGSKCKFQFKSRWWAVGIQTTVGSLFAGRSYQKWHVLFGETCPGRYWGSDPTVMDGFKIWGSCGRLGSLQRWMGKWAWLTPSVTN